jgi:hypothetical protein
MAIELDNLTGRTCGMRSNGKRCVLWDDQSIGDGGFEWFTPEEFAEKFGN